MISIDYIFKSAISTFESFILGDAKEKSATVKTHEVAISEITEAPAFKKPFVYELTHTAMSSVQSQSFGVFAIATTAVEKVLEPQKLLQHLLGVSREIQKIILKNLSIKDLNALELAIRGKPEHEYLVKVLRHIRAEKIFDEMMELFPQCAPFKFQSWPELEGDEKVWLYSLFQLQELGLDFSITPLRSIKAYLNSETLRKELVDLKPQIESYLDTIHTLDLHQFYFVKKRKFPDAIYLLKNLQEVNLFGSKDISSAAYKPGFSCPIKPWTYFKSEKIFAREKMAYEEALKDYHFYKYKMQQYPNIVFY